MGRLIINASEKKSKINKNIYGHFSEHLGRCIYEGLYVGENSEIPNQNGMRTDVVEALKQIKVPVLRWPGGCFADEYHWKDGIGPKENRKKMINTHWGGVVEDNSFGTHEFLELCRQLGCQPYVNGNVGSGTVSEMSEWMEYMTFDGLSPMAQLREANGQKEPWSVTYFGVGNENWGCGGNMRPSYYADLYRRYQTYVRDYGDNKVFRIACGPNGPDYAWTEQVMEIAGKYMDGLTLHYYTVPGDAWNHKGSATDFDTAVYYRTLRKAGFMEELISNHTQIMNRYDKAHKVGLIVDEWGTWYDVEPGTNPGFLYQQNTMRDAMAAAMTLNIFNSHSDRVVMANIAQMVNVLQSVILTEGPKMVLTPTYHVFDLYKHHQDGTLLGSFLDTEEIGPECDRIQNISATASMDEHGDIHITAANLSVEESTSLDCVITQMDMGEITGEILSGAMNDYNDFTNPNRLVLRPMTEITRTKDGFTYTLPPCSVAHICIKA